MYIKSKLHFYSLLNKHSLRCFDFVTLRSTWHKHKQNK